MSDHYVAMPTSAGECEDYKAIFTLWYMMYILKALKTMNKSAWSFIMLVYSTVQMFSETSD